MGYPPKRATAYTFWTGLESRAQPGILQVNPTIAAGDFQVSIDGGALNNLTTLPNVMPAGSKMVRVQLSAAEMTGDFITVVASDVAGAEWADAMERIETSDAEIDEIACDVWSCATRTLTMSGTSIVGAVVGDQINILRGDTLSASITDLGDISDRTTLWFTVKTSRALADSAAIIQITEDDGLVYLNGAAAAASTDGSITVTDAVAGDITITLKPAATDDLIPAACYYDIQVLRNTGAVNTLSYGQVDINPDTTVSIA